MSAGQTRALLALAVCFAGSAALRSAEVAAAMGARLEPAMTAVEAAFSPTPLTPPPPAARAVDGAVERPVEDGPADGPLFAAPPSSPLAWPGSARIEPAIEETAAPKAPAAAASPAETAIPGGDLNAFVAALRERSRELDAYQTRLDERAARLTEAERRIDAKLERIATARAELEGLIQRVEGAQAKDVEHLAQMYSRMKPKKAGAIFNTMDVRFAAEFLSRMKPDAAALIMANMEAARAYEASLVLAGRNRDAGLAAGGLNR